MPVFSYNARDARGELVTGTINADSRAEASRAIRSDGKYVLDIAEGLQSASNSQLDSLRTAEAARRVRRVEVIDFCHQLSVMLETGVPLGSALSAFNEHPHGGDMRRITTIVEHEVNEGSSLSAALARWPRVFPNMMISLIRASEASGTMALMLRRISMYLAKEQKTLKQIRGALTYPCVMIVLALAITVFLMSFVLPRFAMIYANRSAMLPAPTRVLMAIANIWKSHWLAIVVSVAVLVALILFFVGRPLGRRTLDFLRLNTPVLRTMYLKLYLTRATRTMATLILAGVDLLETIRITRGVTRNYYYDQLWDNVCHDLETGKQLSVAIRDTPLIPVSVAQMISAGEKSGRLGLVMERIGEVTEEELDDAVAKTTQFIEPAMVVIMGAVIGFVAISLLLPIMTISRALH